MTLLKRLDMFIYSRVNVTTGYTLVNTRHSRVPTIYSVKRTQLIGRRPLSPCRVRKMAGYTLPRLLFSRTVPRFFEMYPDLAGSGTLPPAIFSARITFRSQQRTPKPKSSCFKQAMATGIASLGGRSAPTKEHQNINPYSSKHTIPLFYSVERTVATERATKTQIFCLATGIACLGGRSAPTKEHQNVDSSPSLTLARDG